MKRILFLVILFSSGFVFDGIAQRIVTGKVTSKEDGATIPGVNVILKGTSTGVTTDLDGKYRIGVPEEGGVLVVSFIGMLSTQEIEVGARSVIDVEMLPDVQQLTEVVVTALGISRDKASLGYAVQEVGSEGIASSNTGNMIDALNGKVAGIQINNAGGQPGAGSSMVIRGYTNISGSNQPLMVIDGVPVNNDTYTSEQSNLGSIDNSTSSANRGIDINPNDIASISVLKGGPATALYGIRAANGAVIISTKSGEKNAGISLSYGLTYTVDEVNKTPPITHAFARGRDGEYSNVTHWSWGPAYASNPVFPNGIVTDLDGDGTSEDVSGLPIPLFKDNWKNFFDDGRIISHNLSLKGGGEKSSFFASIARNEQEGVVPNSEWNRTSLLVNLKNDLTTN